MSATFDPYHKWLGIPPPEQPPHHYRLLGIALFEDDPEVIEAAADRHAAYLQDLAAGPQGALTQKLLREIAAARLCLLDPKRKSAYDAKLHETLDGGGVAAQPAPAEANKALPQSLVRIDAGPARSPRPRPAKKLPDTRKRRRSSAGLGMGLGAAAIVVLLAALLLRTGKAPAKPAADAPRPVQAAIVSPPLAPPAPFPAPRSSSPIDPGPPAQAKAPAAPQFAETLFAAPSQALPQAFQAPPTPATEEPAPDLPATSPLPEGLVLWLDAADRSTIQFASDGQVNRWQSKAGASQARRGYRASPPNYVLWDESIGLAVMRHSRPQRQWLEIDHEEAFRLGNRHTIVLVARGTEGVLISKEVPSEAPDNAVAGLCLGPSFPHVLSKEVFAELAVHVLISDGGNTAWRINGELRGGLGLVALDNAARWRLGRRSLSGVTDYFAGDLAEALVFNRPLDDDETIRLERHLIEKWLTAKAP